MYDGIWGKEDPRLKVIAGKTALFLLKRYYNLGQIIIFLLAVASCRTHKDRTHNKGDNDQLKDEKSGDQPKGKEGCANQKELELWLSTRLWPLFIYFYLMSPEKSLEAKWGWAMKKIA